MLWNPPPDSVVRRGWPSLVSRTFSATTKPSVTRPPQPTPRRSTAAESHCRGLSHLQPYNKATEYGFGVYGEMHFWFHKLPKEHKSIAMSGYGWNDRGINGKLMEWLHAPEERRLVLMHEKPNELAEYSKSALWHRYKPLVAANRIIPHPRWLQNTTLVDVWDLFH